jgi:D-serine deaminase-like pyridoxal phosphate-dependent protein
VAREDECAYSILATVVSTAVPGRAVVDAGSKALSKELHGTAGIGYAALAARPEVRVVALSEEHGVLDITGSDWRPRVGELVRLLPNHVCVSVNLQDRVIARDGDHWETWSIEGRGRVAS